jgi:lysophospholipase L1-like esterase
MNMPLTPENLSLLPRGFYADFKNIVKASLDGQGLWVALDEKLHLPNSFYSDSVHLNNKGAQELNKKIVEAIAEGSF